MHKSKDIFITSTALEFADELSRSVKERLEDLDLVELTFVDGIFSRAVNAQGFEKVLRLSEKDPDHFSDLLGNQIEPLCLLLQDLIDSGLPLKQLLISDDLAFDSSTLFKAESNALIFDLYRKLFSMISGVKGLEPWTRKDEGFEPSFQHDEGFEYSASCDERFKPTAHSDGDIRLLIPLYKKVGYKSLHVAPKSFDLLQEIVRLATDAGLSVRGGFSVDYLSNPEYQGWIEEELAQNEHFSLCDDGGFVSVEELEAYLDFAEQLRHVSG